MYYLPVVYPYFFVPVPPFCNDPHQANNIKSEEVSICSEPKEIVKC